MEVVVRTLDQQVTSLHLHCASSSSSSDKDSAEVEEIFDETSTLDNVSADLLSPLSPPGNIAISDDEDGSLPWNPTLYNLQAQAPTPKCVDCEDKLLNSSTQYGQGYHGHMNEDEVINKLAGKDDGSYLVWHDLSGRHTLSLVHAQKPVHLTLDQQGSTFYCGDKEFGSMVELVQDQLIQLFFQSCHATSAVVDGQLCRRMTLQQKKLQRRPCRRLKGSSRPRGLDQSQSCSLDDVSGELGAPGVTQPTPIEEGVVAVSPTNERHHKYFTATTPAMRHESRGLTTRSVGNITELRKADILKKSLTIDTVRDHRTRRFRRSVSDDLQTTISSDKAPSIYHKCHKFEVHSYKGPQWCDMCRHFLWGLSQQGMKCQCCGINIHKQCYSLAMEVECTPTKKMIKQVFGVDLTTVAKMDGSEIPKIVKQCVEVIEERGLSDEGIYRVSGNSSCVIEIKEKFNEGEVVDFSQYMDINIMTGALKMFLRELPVPVISFDAYNEIMRATALVEDMDSPSTDWRPLANSLMFLPKAHYLLLKYLSQHLHKVVQNSALNRMTPHNLAVVFAPTLMRAPSDNFTIVKDFSLQKHFVECIIQKHSLLFE